MVEFAYAVGRIRALEVYLLSQSQLLRMLEAKDFDTAYSILRENPHYAAKIDQLAHPFDYQALLQKELEDTKVLLEELAPHEVIFVIFEKYRPEVTIGGYLFTLKQLAKKYQIPLFHQYVQGFSILNQLKLDLLLGEAATEEFENKYRYTDYYLPIKTGLEAYQKTGSLAVLEREIDNFLLQIIKKAKYQVFGIEPLIGYALAKEIEIKNLRLLLTGKIMQIKPEEIKERLRGSYV